MALAVWSLSVVVVDQLRLITCLKDYNPLNSMYRALFGDARRFAESAGVARTHRARGTGFPRRGEGAV